MTHLPPSGRTDLHPSRLVVIGGGASGVLVLLHALRHGAQRPSLDVLLLEPGPLLGDGLAYGSRDPSHLLNVPAGRMGAFADQPGDFLAWLQEAGRDPGAHRFVPRAWYGEYLRGRLDAALAALPAGVQFRHATRRAVDVVRAREGWRVEDASGGTWDADQVVLATGHVSLPPPRAWGVEALGEAWIGSPGGSPGLEGIAAGEDVLIVGTGLTAVDAVLSLARQGHRGRMHAVSRHGWWPRVHGPLTSAAPAAVPGMSLRASVRAVCRQGRSGDGRAAVDALRALTPALWAGWTHVERRRFLRHVRAAWDVHRHRMAPEAAEVLQRLHAAGRLATEAGRITRLERTRSGVRVTLCPRGAGAPRHEEVQRVIGCLGVSPLEGRNPVLEALVRRGTVTPDALGLGLDVGDDGAVPGAPGLYAVGPLRRGRLWESTAVPELRAQAAALGAVLAGAT